MIEKGVDLTTIQKMMKSRYGVNTDIYEDHNTFSDKKYYVLRYQCDRFAIYIRIGTSISVKPKRFISVRWEDLKSYTIRWSDWLFNHEQVAKELDKYLKPIQAQMSLF